MAKGQGSDGRFTEGNKLSKGRKPGSKNAITIERKELAVASREAFYELHARIMQKLSGSRASVFAMIEYADLLAKRGWGANPKKVSLPGEEGTPFAELVKTMQQHDETQSETKGEGAADDVKPN